MISMYRGQHYMQPDNDNNRAPGRSLQGEPQPDFHEYLHEKLLNLNIHTWQCVVKV